MIKLSYAVVIAAVLSSAAFGAVESSDVSLDREVDQYLAESQTKWDDPSTMRAHFSKGLKFETADGNFTMEIFGRLMWDSFWTSTSDFPTLDIAKNGTFFRRVRLGVGGTVYKRTVFKVQLDFAKGVVDLKDVYVGLKKVPGVSTILFGHQKEAFSLQELTSSKYIETMERATPVNTFAPSRNSGVAVYTPLANNRVYVAGGLFWGETSNQGVQISDGGGAFTFRITGLPVLNKDQKLLVHVGFGFSYRNVDSVRYRTRPGTGTAERLIDTTAFAAEGVVLIGFEVAVRWRSFDFQAEYIQADVDAPASGDPTFGGWYVQFGWWITGEVRKYKDTRGTWSRTSPLKKFGADEAGGWGAWQLVIRWDTVDLNDGLITGGEMDTIVFGANWHWNPNTRMLFNFILADVKSGPSGMGDLNIFMVRVQFDF